MAKRKPPTTPSDESSRQEEVKAWFTELTAARKREKDFRTQGAEIIAIYEGDNPNGVPFNIAYTNTTTMLPAIFSAVPLPEVRPRYNPKSPIPQIAAQTAQALLEFYTTDRNPDYTQFGELMRMDTLGGLVPGRGLSRVCYTSEVEKDGEGKPRKIKSEYVYGETVPYNRFLHGFATTWDRVPWTCYEHLLTKDEAEDMGFDPALLAEVKFEERDKETQDGDDGDRPRVQDSEGVKLGLFYEIWEKKTRRIYWLGEGQTRDYLQEKADPYGLRGFYDCPRPLTFVRRLSSLVPRSLYQLYRNQAEEVNDLTIRITRITASIKATGLYNNEIEGLVKVIEMKDGEFTPISNLAGLGDGVGLEKAIWFWPVDKLITVLVQLVQQREAAKGVCYEILGIADIMRGASTASESATAQQLKNNWGGLRLGDPRASVSDYCAAFLALVAELAFTKLSTTTLAAMTATPLPSAKEQEAAKAQLQQFQQQQMVAQMQVAQAAQAQQPAPGGPPQGPPPGPPPGPQPQGAEPDPGLIATAQAPTQEAIFSLLKDELLTAYTVDIETNSTLASESAEDKESLNEFLAAMSQLLLALGPMVENGSMPFSAAKAMIIAISRKFRLGRELQDELEQMQAPQQQGGGAQAAALQKQMADIQKQATDLDKQKGQLQVETAKAKGQLQVQGMQNELAATKRDMMAQIQDAKRRAEAELAFNKLSALLEQHAAGVDNALAFHSQQVSAEHQEAAVNEESQRQVFTAKTQAASQVQAAKQAAAKRPAAKGKK